MVVKKVFQQKTILTDEDLTAKAMARKKEASTAQRLTRYEHCRKLQLQFNPGTAGGSGQGSLE